MRMPVKMSHAILIVERQHKLSVCLIKYHTMKMKNLAPVSVISALDIPGTKNSLEVAVQYRNPVLL
jgi:hypothetical protein